MSFRSTLPPDTPEIADDNWTEFAIPMAGRDEDGAQVSETGYTPRDFDQSPRGSIVCAEAFPHSMLIPRSEWRERIEEKERKKTRLSDLCTAAGPIWTNQSPSWYCWCYCVTHGVMALNAVQNERPRRLVPESVAGPIMNYRKKGGWPSKALDYIAEHGIADDTAWPWNGHTAANKKQYFAPSRANAAQTKITEWWELRTFEEKASCLLRNIPVPSGYSWMGHAMASIDLIVMRGGGFGCLDLDSYARNNMYNTKAIEERRAAGNDMVAPRFISPSGKE